ncbi:MAG: hypothetical protein JO317_05190 [Verrucomicrobiae bacterium]|nr:hypothetical protein [Verrucomicrobiae bacterium]
MASSKPAEPGTVPPPPVEKPKEPEKPKLSEPVQVASARPVLPPPAETPRPLPRPGGRRQFDVLSPEGVVREGPPDFVLAMVNRLMPAVLQDFGKADPGKLPGGTQVFYWQPSGDCILVDPKGTQVDKAKLSWRLFADEMEDGKNFLQLSLDGIPTNANHLAIRFETPSLEPQQPYFLGIMLRAADKPVKAKITLEPTFLSYQQLDVPTHWRLFMLLVPPEHPDSRAVMVGFNTPGKVDIGEIRLAPLPQGFRPPPRGPNGNQNYQGNDSGNPGMNGGDPLGGQPPYFQGPRQPNNRRR